MRDQLDLFIDRATPLRAAMDEIIKLANDEVMSTDLKLSVIRAVALATVAADQTAMALVVARRNK